MVAPPSSHATAFSDRAVFYMKENGRRAGQVTVEAKSAESLGKTVGALELTVSICTLVVNGYRLLLWLFVCRVGYASTVFTTRL